MSAPYIKIFDSTVTLVGLISAYDDFTFKRGWNDPGEFSFQTDWTVTYAAVLVEGNIIYVDANHAGWIDTVTITRKGNTDIIEVSGIELKDMISWRYTDNGHVGFTFTSKTPEYTVKQLIQYNIGSSASASRKIDEVSIVASAGKGTAIDLTSYHKRLDEEVYALLKPDGLGLSATLDVTNQLIVFDVLAGTDMTAGQSTNNRVMLNVDMGTLDAIEYKESKVGFANFAFVGGQGEGNDRTIVDVGTATGASRRETFVDARDISSAAELTDRGTQKLAEVEQSEIIDCAFATALPSSVSVFPDMPTTYAYLYPL